MRCRAQPVGSTSAIDDRRAAAGGHDTQAGQVLVEIGVDAVDIGERRLVHLLQDRVLDPLFGLERIERFGEGIDDGGRRQGILGRLEIGIAEQVADAAIERLQLVVARVLDDARDVAGDDRLVHARRVDQRQLVDVDLRFGVFGLVGDLAGDAVVHPRAHPPLEFAHQRRPLRLQSRARIHIDLLLVAHVGPACPVHQHVRHLVHQRREGEQHPVNGEIPAVRQDLRHLARHGPPGGRFGGGGVHPRSAGASRNPPPVPGRRGSGGRSLGTHQSRNLRTKIR